MPVADARPEDSAWPAMSWPPPPDTVLGRAGRRGHPRRPDRDAEALFEALDDDRVWEHLPFRVSDPDAYARVPAGPRRSGLVPLGRAARVPYAGLPAGAVVGTSSYLDVAVHDARLEIGATAYRHDVWATAVNPDTKLLLLGYAFDELHVGRVQLKTDVRNTRSPARHRPARRPLRGHLGPLPAPGRRHRP